MTISSGLSATNLTAHLVASQMPDFPVTIVDTKSVGIAAGLVVMGVVRMVEEGVPYEELGDRHEALADETLGYFTVRELSYLHHGGRIIEATYRLGSILNLKPVFTCNDEGKYLTVKKCRGWEKAPTSELSLIRGHAECFGRVICAVCCTKAEPHMEELIQKDSGADTELHRNRKDRAHSRPGRARRPEPCRHGRPAAQHLITQPLPGLSRSKPNQNQLSG